MGKMTDAFGIEAVEKLAAQAINVGCYPPVRQTRNRHTCQVPWSEIHIIREAMEGAGIDWREIKRKVGA